MSLSDQKAKLVAMLGCKPAKVEQWLQFLPGDLPEAGATPNQIAAVAAVVKLDQKKPKLQRLALRLLIELASSENEDRNWWLVKRPGKKPASVELEPPSFDLGSAQSLRGYFVFEKARFLEEFMA